MPKYDFNKVAKQNTFSLENLWTAASAAPLFQSYVPDALYIKKLWSENVRKPLDLCWNGIDEM